MGNGCKARGAARSTLRGEFRNAADVPSKRMPSGPLGSIWSRIGRIWVIRFHQGTPYVPSPWTNYTGLSAPRRAPSTSRNTSLGLRWIRSSLRSRRRRPASAPLLMGGGGAGGLGPQGGIFARMRARRQVLDAVEANLRERGLPIPPVPMSQRRVFAVGFACGLLLGLLIGLIFWELT